jgi:hypothetical protein
MFDDYPELRTPIVLAAQQDHANLKRILPTQLTRRRALHDIRTATHLQPDACPGL